MNLPDTQFAQYTEARNREGQAMLHLGIAVAELELHKHRLLAQAKADRTAQDAAVHRGLLALGLPADDQQRHFHVEADGTVLELIAGEYVEPRMEA